MTQTLRIGRILYTNVWPIFHHFPADRFAGRIELHTEVPSTLNRAMAEGRIDMGPISSFAYGEHAEEYLLFPDLSVSAFGRVNSILLFHKKPLTEIAAGGRIMLANTSAASVNLLKILMAKRFAGNPVYRFDEARLSSMRPDEDAALLIGDDAIRADWSNSDFEVTDLGELWREWTGRWMSFAVWAVREDAAERHPELLSDVYRAFLESKRQGLAQPEEMIRHAVQTVGGSEAYWRSYFGGLSFDFGEEQRKGLQLYYDFAYELGLLNRPAAIRLWQDIPSYR
ncbi:menaquinone biosynthetic enzyme MqnA/MqnD family protein [Gorillibacterium timonense]|uniref:menaquinone biosynthetic enzyme MqnA/MqnD family protein n=1 Tax=Gorillibacterium timonense TaxID=1689269 RepID=UPI00071CA853|nr:menaquinone biosynthesis protein [Gorillibacterium timonense]